MTTYQEFFESLSERMGAERAVAEIAGIVEACNLNGTDCPWGENR